MDVLSSFPFIPLLSLALRTHLIPAEFSGPSPIGRELSSLLVWETTNLSPVEMFSTVTKSDSQETYGQKSFLKEVIDGKIFHWQAQVF
jgi:hypothetical protein